LGSFGWAVDKIILILHEDEKSNHVKSTNEEAWSADYFFRRNDSSCCC
jgi:hypothetical protein